MSDKLLALLPGNLLSIPRLMGAVWCYPWIVLVNILYHFTSQFKYTRQGPPISYQEYFDTVTKKDKRTPIYDDIQDSKRLSDIFKNNYNSPIIQRRHDIIKRILQLWSLKFNNECYSILSKNLQFDDPLVSYWNKSQFESGFNTLSILFKSKISGINNQKSDIKENFFDGKSISNTLVDVKNPLPLIDTIEEASEVFDESCVSIENYQDAIVIKMSVTYMLNFDLLLSTIPKFIERRLINYYNQYISESYRNKIEEILLRLYNFVSITTHEAMVLKLTRVYEKGHGLKDLDSDSEEKEESSELNHGNETNNYDYKEYVSHIMELWYGKYLLQFYGVSKMTRRVTGVITYPACYFISKLVQIGKQFKTD